MRGVIGRPPKADRASVRGTTLTLKMTDGERALLERLVDARRAELREQTGEDVPLTASSLLRSLIMREVKARGLEAADVAPAKHESLKKKGTKKP